MGTPVPNWVAQGAIPASQATDGYIYSHHQYREHGTPAHHARHRIRLGTLDSLTELSEVAFSFSPAFERLHIHYIRLIREHETRDIAIPANLRVEQKKVDMRLRIVDDVKRLVFIPEDVRLGDELEFAYTILGKNPAYGTRTARFVSFRRWGGPIAVEVVRPEDAEWQPKLLPRGLPSQSDHTDDRFRWTLTPPLVPPGREDHVPRWIQTYPELLSSSFGSWDEVSRWAHHLYKHHEVRGDSYDELRQAVLSLPTQDARVVGAILRVRRDVRYLGVELGHHAFEPHDTETVAKRRYGDCKDKSLLLATLLRDAGVVAEATLVSTDSGKRIATLEPAPSVFDHVIVRFWVDGKEYWVDPTDDREIASLDDLSPPPYGYALPIVEGGSGLVPITVSVPPEPTFVVVESFRLDPDAESATLVVHTTLRGEDAVRERRALKGTLSARAAEYLEHYEAYYPGIRQGSMPRIAEDGPELKVVERYDLPQAFFDRGAFTATAWAVTDVLERPDVRHRKFPYDLGHPYHRRHEIRIDYGEELENHDCEDAVLGGALRLTVRRTCRSSGVDLAFTMVTLQETVKPEVVGEFVEEVDRKHRELSWSVTRDAAEEEVSDVAFWVAMAVLLLPVFGLLYLVWRGMRSAAKWVRRSRWQRAERAGESSETPRHCGGKTLASIIARERCPSCKKKCLAPRQAPNLVRLGQRRIMAARLECSRCHETVLRYYEGWREAGSRPSQTPLESNPAKD